MNAVLGFFATIIGYPLTLIYDLINNYGLAIILLTVLVRLCLLPLYSKQIRYSTVISEIQPEITEIQTRYASDRATMSAKLQEVYKRENISPASGCLPLLIQMPIIMGLYQLLRTPLSFMTQPYMMAAVHEKFIWVPDLSQPDNWILPILAGITTYFTYVATSANTSVEKSQAGMMNAMKYFFPIMIFIMGKSFPSGLALYWTIGNVFTILQTILLNKNRKTAKRKERAKKEAMKNVKKEAAN